MTRAKSSKKSASATAIGSKIPGVFEWIALAAIELLVVVLIRSVGVRRGLELMPWPDGLEYAAAAANLAAGRGPVLHFGGYTYPSRYTAGYPLIIDLLCRGSVAKVPPLFVSLCLGMLSVLLVFWLARPLFGRAAALTAALILAQSPVFLTYSSLVMSDVPTMCVTLYAVLVVRFAAADDSLKLAPWIRSALWLAFGILAGFSTIIRPTNVVILAGLALCLLMVPPGERSQMSLLKTAVAAAIGFAIPVAWQLRLNAVHLGSPFASGYAWWVPEVYGAGGKTFSAAYLFGPTMPRNPHGNVVVYITTLLGLDGMLGDPGNARYFLYPFAGAVFAAVGMRAILRSNNSAARRLAWFGIGYLGALTILYCFYVFTDVAFILPGAFIVFIAAGAGATSANRWMREVMRTRDRSASQLATGVGVLSLDFLLVLSLATEVAVRLTAQPRASSMVEALESLDSTIPSDATVVSNISLQFLELYLPDKGRQFVGLNSLDPGERFTDYHLHRLYEKRSAGWKESVPPVVFNGVEIEEKEAGALERVVAKAPIFLLIAAPESDQYADVLKSEMDKLQSSFRVEEISQNDAVAVYQLSALK